MDAGKEEFNGGEGEKERVNTMEELAAWRQDEETNNGMAQMRRPTGCRYCVSVRD